MEKPIRKLTSKELKERRRISVRKCFLYKSMYDTLYEMSISDFTLEQLEQIVKILSIEERE